MEGLKKCPTFFSQKTRENPVFPENRDWAAPYPRPSVRSGSGLTSGGCISIDNHSRTKNEGVLFNTNLKLGIELVSFARAAFLERFGRVVKMSEILIFFSAGIPYKRLYPAGKIDVKKSDIFLTHPESTKHGLTVA